MKKSDANFTKVISGIISESSLENLKIQSVIDKSWSHGYRKGWTKGYFSGLLATGSILAVAWVWRSVGRLEGSEKGAKEATFWRKLYVFKAKQSMDKNCEREQHDDGPDDEEDPEEGKC